MAIIITSALTRTQPTGGFGKQSGEAFLPSAKANRINSSDLIDIRINYARIMGNIPIERYYTNHPLQLLDWCATPWHKTPDDETYQSQLGVKDLSLMRRDPLTYIDRS
jgi:hypothetical protein